MSRIDDAITSDKRKRKWLVLTAVLFFTGLLAVYLSWLFLLKGFTVKVLPAEAAQSLSLIHI